MTSDASLTIVDLFAGAGGLSTGIAKACEDLSLEPAVDVELHAVNHWEPAIQTHEENHPWAEHYHARVEELYPPDVVDPGSVTLLAGGPECTHFSNARGGKPVSDQKRASAWHALDWIEKLRPDHVLLENVKEFRDWGPIEDGDPTRDGSIFDRWVGMLEALGYSVVYDEGAEDYGVVLNAADYGDPQSRERLFIMASREKLPSPPDPTHVDADPEKPDRRTAADVIDWSDLGSSLWTRDLENPRVQPLSENTMARIAEGIRRHCSSRLEPFADALEGIGPHALESLRETVVPAEYADVVAAAVDDPFLVRVPGSHSTGRSPTAVVDVHKNGTVTEPTEPLKTVTSEGRNRYLMTPDSFCLRQQSGGVPVSVGEPLSTVSKKGAIGLATVEQRSLVKPRNGSRGGLHSNSVYPPATQPLHTITAGNHDGHLVTPSLIHYSHGGELRSLDDPMATIATERGGAFALSSPYLCPMYNSRAGQRPRTRRVDRPLMTVPASKGAPAGVAAPFLVEYYGNSETQPVDEPVPTVPANDRFALCVPECWPWGLDVRYRMLKPDELKQAQGFPEDYEITGETKKTITGQIGNAVPVNLARALARHLLADETPSLSTFGGGIQGDDDVDVPDYSEVASDD